MLLVCIIDVVTLANEPINVSIDGKLIPVLVILGVVLIDAVMLGIGTFHFNLVIVVVLTAVTELDVILIVIVTVDVNPITIVVFDFILTAKTVVAVLSIRVLMIDVLMIDVLSIHVLSIHVFMIDVFSGANGDLSLSSFFWVVNDWRKIGGVVRDP